MQSIIMIKLHYYTVYYIIIMEIDVICSVISSFCALGEELTAGGHQYLQQGDVFHSFPFWVVLPLLDEHEDFVC